jgi:hypothetical protein
LRAAVKEPWYCANTKSRRQRPKYFASVQAVYGDCSACNIILNSFQDLSLLTWNIFSSGTRTFVCTS